MSLTIIDNEHIFQKDVIGNVRKAQEDSHDIAALTPNGDVFVVCDGMGGHVGGKQASSIAVNSIVEYMKKERYPQPKQALNDALQFANMQILGYANEYPELKGMGTTACIVLLQESEAYIAHVGDSRIYLYLGKEKQLHCITKDHSFVQALVDAGQITYESAEHHPNKNRILKALGIKPDLAPSFESVKPKNGDVFLICTDGLSGMISDSTMRDVLMQNTSIEDKGETLINLALEAGGLDNITLELVQIANSPHAKSVFKSYNPTSSKPSTHKKRRHFFIITIVTVIALLLSYFLLYAYTVKGIDARIKTVKEEIKKKNDSNRVDGVRIGEVKKLLDTFDIKKQGYNSSRLEGYDSVEAKKNSLIEELIEEKKYEIMNRQERLDSLQNKKSIDSIRLANMNIFNFLIKP